MKRHYKKAASLAARWLESSQRRSFFGSRARVGPRATRAFSRMQHPDPARADWLSLRRGVRPPVRCGMSTSPMTAVGQKCRARAPKGMTQSAWSAQR